MSIQAPQGILNIPNATLRVGKLAVDEVVGADTILNTVARNTILLVDGEEYTENKNWALKLPNAWAGEFDIKSTGAGNYAEFNFYNEGASSNAQGYNLTFNDTAVELRYDGGSAIATGVLSSTIVNTYRKVRLMFERTILSVTVDGTLIFTHDDTSGPRPRVYSTTAGGFLNFFTDGGAIDNLKIVNEKWMSDGTSNIAYVGGGEVAVGKALAFNRVSNVSQIKVDSNVVTEYTGPHDRPLRKYPEVAMTQNDESATSGYVASASSSLTSSPIYSAFDATGATSFWHSQYPYYTFVTGTYNPGQASQGTGTPSGTLPTTELISGHQGEWIKLQMPKKIKLEEVRVYASNRAAGTNVYQMPKDIAIAGSNDGTNWYLVDSGTLRTGIRESYGMTSLPVTTSSYYSYLALIVKTIDNQGANYSAIEIANIEYYGYEEDPPAGDTSIDTTFTSIMNTPQTTGANVYVDGNLGETFTNRVTGPTPTGTSTTYDQTGKYWELSGNVESNVTIEANTFLEGDQPHAVSVWFNSSNLEANVSNTCVFSISDQEKLDSVNLDLQSNTWHNLTYAYQGEGGSRVTYLDGRKVAEDKAEDTFGDYPPFAMTGYSQGGYVVSASSEYNTTQYNAWKAFDGDTSPGAAWLSENAQNYNGGSGLYSGSANLGSDSGGVALPDADKGEWIKIELPHRIYLDYLWMVSVPVANGNAVHAKDFKVFGSNNDKNWDEVLSRVGHPIHHSDVESASRYITADTNDKAYKYYALVITRLNGFDHYTWVSELKLYGHRENDLVRLPDPTNVLKYPHIAMTGPAQRGYVATASTTYSLYEPWDAFNGVSDVGGNNYWSGANSLYSASTPFNFTGSGDPYETSVSGTTYTGDWLQIELPHRIRVDHVLFNVVTTARFPRQGVYAGSNDGSTWFELHTFSGLTTTDEETRVPSSGSFNGSSASNAYKYIRLIITHNNGNGYAACDELKIFGTGVDSVPIQIGGGNIDKVANFRVYDKFIGEDQALEIWDAQKDAFGRVKSSMTLQKGRLGIGTTEPEGRLAVADEPHNLEEFPPRAMTGYENYFEGHGVFCVYASTELINANHKAWKSFNKFRGNDGWHTGGVNYTSGVYTAGKSLGGISGDYLVLKLPYKINLKSIAMVPRSGLPQRGPGSGVILGSNDEVNWEQVHSFSGITYTDNVYTTIDAISSTKTYNVFAMVVTNLAGTGVNTDYVNLAEWKLFGTREQGQSVLHDGQLTLTKSLNVPRIGPALDADDTPRRDRLVVEYNTSTNPTFEGVVRDTSGRGNDGMFYGGASYDANEKALVFNGSSDGVELYIKNPAGAWIHTFSFWVKPIETSTGETILQLGTHSASDTSSLRIENGTIFRWFFYDNDITYTNPLIVGGWYHVVAAYDGGSVAASRRLWVNGVEIAQAGTQTPAALTLPENARLRLAYQSGGNFFGGSISNFKLYDCALTAEEVKTLYDMGRCDEGHHVVNFSKTRVGIGLGDGEAPRGALDVRGDLYLSGNIIRNTSSAKSGGVWLPTYQFEVGGSTFVEDQRHGQYHIVNNVLTAVYRARVVSNSGAGTLRPSLPGGHKVAGVASGSTVVIGWWARNLDFGAANVGPYMLSDTTNGYIQPFHPGQTNNQVRLDGGSLEANTYWTMFLSYPIE
jgi:hypothetical protein